MAQLPYPHIRNSASFSGCRIAVEFDSSRDTRRTHEYGHYPEHSRTHGLDLLDFVIGSAIAVLAALLLLAAYAIASQVSVPAVYMIAATLAVIGWAFQIVGHAVFERRRPAFLDNLTHMLIGPMFVVAKAFTRFGFRRDLSDALQKSAHPVVRDLTAHPAEKCAEVRPQ